MHAGHMSCVNERLCAFFSGERAAAMRHKGAVGIPSADPLRGGEREMAAITIFYEKNTKKHGKTPGGVIQYKFH